MNEAGMLNEELLLLALFDGEGRPVYGSVTAYPLLTEGGMLTELVLRERIHIDGHGNVLLLSSAALDTPLLDSALSMIGERPDGKSVSDWLSIFGGAMNSSARTLRALIDGGDVEQRSRAFLGFAPTVVYAVGETERWDELRHRLDQVAHGDSLMDERHFAMLCLLSATPLLGTLYPRRQKNLRKRLKKIVREIASFGDEDAGPELVQRMLSLAMIAAAVAAPHAGVNMHNTLLLSGSMPEESDE